MLLIGDITFPRWNGDAQFDPYITEKQIDDALNHGKSLDAAERTAGANEFQIDNTDAKVTGKLLLKAVDKRRADVVRFMVERGADLNHVWEVTCANCSAEQARSALGAKFASYAARTARRCGSSAVFTGTLGIWLLWSPRCTFL